MANLVVAPPIEFVVAEPPFYLGTYSDGAQHQIGEIQYSSVISIEYHSDHFISTDRNGELIRFERAGEPAQFAEPITFKTNDVLSWRVVDGVNEVVNLLSMSLYTPGDNDYHWWDGAEPKKAEEQPSAYPFGGRRYNKPMENKVQLAPDGPRRFGEDRSQYPRSTKTSHVTQFCLTSDKQGIGIYRVWFRESSNESKVYNFYDTDSVWIEATTRKFGTVDRGANYDVNWNVSYYSGGYLVATEIKEREMSNQPTEKTAAEQMNEGVGHWGADPKDTTPFLTEVRTKLNAQGYSKIMKQQALKSEIMTWIGSTNGKPDGCPLANRTLAVDTAVAKGLEILEAKKAEVDKPECAHDMDGSTCKYCKLHWSKIPKYRSAFWAYCNELLDKHNADEKTAPERDKLIHGILGVEHLEDCDLSLDDAKNEIRVNVEAMYPLPNNPEQLAKEVWSKIIPELYEVCPEFKDAKDTETKQKAASAVLGAICSTLGRDFTTMQEMIAAVGSDEVLTAWGPAKLLLKPAQPKQTPANGNGNKPPENKPAEQSKPQQPKPAQQPQQTNAVATVPQQPQNIIQFNSPELAALEAKRQEAAILIKSGLLPKSVDTPEKVIVIAMMGDALGIQKIVALNNINVIAGKPTVSPQLMLALVRKSKQLEDFSCTDDGQACTVKMTRKGEPEHVEVFSMDDAKRMMTTEWVNGNKTTIPLSEKANWKQQPATMRKWRAIAAACRVVFPDITWGLASYTPEEMDPNTPIDAEYVEADVA